MFILANEANTGTWLIRSFFGMVDQLVYYLLSLSFNLIFNISNVTISSEIVKAFSSRIYFLIAIFMLFKLAFVFLNGLVNPESMTDKQTGLHKIVGRIVTSLFLLVMIPFIFTKAFEYQQYILPLIPKVVLGTNGVFNYEINQDGVESSSVGSIISVNILGGFITKNPECSDPVMTVATTNDLVGNALTKCSSNRSIYAYEYSILGSTIVGIIATVMVLFICIDISIRVFKLALLQILAPIPIISYVDPKSQKDGAFSGWLKQCISTYLDLFLKMMIVFFLTFAIQQLFEGNFLILADGSSVLQNPMVTIFLVLGLLFFMRMAIPFLYSVLGIKNPQSSIGLGALMGGLGALSGGGGLAGFGKGMLGGADTTATAVSQGKAAGNMYTAQRDTMLQTMTGDKDYKGGVINNVQRKLMETVGNKQGYNAANLKAFSNNASAGDYNADIAEQKFRSASYAVDKDIENLESAQEEFRINRNSSTAQNVVNANSALSSSKAAQQEAYDEWQDKKAESANAEKALTNFKDAKKRYSAKKKSVASTPPSIGQDRF